MSNPDLKVAIDKFKKVSTSQIEQLQEEGYQYESAISTLLKKIAINRETCRNYSDEEIDYVLNRCPQNITRAGAIRILNLKDEVRTLREAGYLHREVVEVLALRLQKTSGFKRSAQNESPCAVAVPSPPPKERFSSPTSPSSIPTSSRSVSMPPSFPSVSAPLSLREKEKQKAPSSPTLPPPKKIRRKGENFVVVSDEQENEHGRNLEGWSGGEDRTKSDDERKRKMSSSPGAGSRKRMKVD
eukprot:CAMPEP_0201542722 /NCGR_PEP_ID=MMETSP0161_2-20130828/72187_1 /ASSEMBLY_ACC=CAM_ASM_000251 /TAXON_ID=180227 /ORGANISM="Neoparamoeba aestuarina, Strain SoJaBio B1-5/56/2" /LENGTH=241 /DNA_ID=CAMNT_0047950397 /DNA_START=376 /DNA_END=1101 /DNA_ORIENTATION=+